MPATNTEFHDTMPLLMLEQIRDVLSAIGIDKEMEQVVRGSGISAKLLGEDWGDECVEVARARRVGVISPSDYEKLSPAAKALLPEELVIS